MHIPRYTRTTLLAAALLLLSGTTAWSLPYRSMHMGVRPMGMGGAFTAVASDQNAINFNPAGLSRTGSFGLSLVSPMVSASEDSYDLYDDFDKIDQDNTQEVSDLLKEHVGEFNHIEVAADLYTGFHVGNAGIMVAAVGNGYIDMSIRNPTFPELHVTSDVDYGGQIGIGYELVPGFSLGVTFKALHRESIDQVYTAVDIADNDFEDTLEDDQVSGDDTSFDLGLLWTREIPVFSRVTLGLAGINIKEMDFGDARNQKSQYNAGIAFEQHFSGFTLIEAFDYHDLTDNLAEDDSTEKKLHMGAELRFPALFSMRAGLSQGYYTAGATLDLKIIRLDVATYGEEVGVYGGQKEDRRYMAQVSTGWTW